jgi:hypothetical protein
MVAVENAVDVGAMLLICHDLYVPVSKDALVLEVRQRPPGAAPVISLARSSSLTTAHRQNQAHGRR